MMLQNLAGANLKLVMKSLYLVLYINHQTAQMKKRQNGGPY